MKTIAVTLVCLSLIAHAAIEPLSQIEALDELQESHVALVETVDPFTDESTLSLQLVGFVSDEIEKNLRDLIREIQEQTRRLEAANDAGVSVPGSPLPSLREPTRFLFTIQCDAEGRISAFPLVADENSPMRGWRMRIDDRPMVEFGPAIQHTAAAAMLSHLKEASRFVVQHNPPSAGDPVVTFKLQSEDAFDRRPFFRELEERCRLRGR